MEERGDAGVADRRRKASAWPVFVALGLAAGELGVVLGLYPVAVGGLLLFAGSVAGIVTEAGYAERPWRLLAALGVLLVAGGALVVYSQLDAATLAALRAAVAAPSGVVLRGYAIAGAGVLSLFAGGVGALLTDRGTGATR